MNKKFLIFLVAILLALTVGLVIKVGTSYATCGIQTEPIIIDFHSELSADQTSVVFYYKISSNSSNRCGNPLYIYLENVPDQAPSILIVLKDGNWSGTTSGYTSSYPVSNLPNGTYVVRLEAQVSANVSGSVTATFTINNRPTCTISAPASVNTGQTFNASASMTGGSGGYKNFAWNFGDGTTGISQSSIHSYSLVGGYTITFTFSDSRSTPGTCTTPITVTGTPQAPAPTATLTANPTSVAPGGVPIMSWSSTNAANCSVLTGAGFRTGGAVQGSCNTTSGATCPNPLADTTTFSIRCYEFADKTGRTADAAVTVTVVRLNASAVGECQQNYPSAAVQSYISWNAVPGAASYTVKEVRFLFDRTVGSTSQTHIIDGNLSFGSSYSYYVIAYNASGNEIARSSNVGAGTPASCSAAPACGSGGTNVITPPQQSTNVGSTASFVSLYDPDGGGSGRYGNFNVSPSASWVSGMVSVATSQGGGVFRGVAAGTAPIGSTFCSVQANGSLDVNNPAQPDFSISIVPATPQHKTVAKPGTTTYVVSISPSGGFSGNVALSISGTKPLHAGTNLVSFSPASISTSGNSTLTLSVSALAAVEIYTFAVVGTSGSSHSADADLNVTLPSAGFACSLSADPNPVDAGTPVDLSAAASGGSGSYRYRFFYEPGSVDIDYLPGSSRSYVYHSAGVKNPSVDVLDTVTSKTTNCSTSVTVNESGPPGGESLSCTLDAAPKFGPAPLDVAFQISNVSGGSGNYQYRFDYGDSQSAPYPAANPSSHTYDNQGSYAATGSVKDDAGNSGSCSKDITGNDIIIWVNPPTPSGCTFTASSSSILYYQSSTLSWSCPPTDTSRNCTIKDDAGKPITTGIQSGTKTVKPLHDTTYTLSCTGAPTVDNSTASVKVGFIPVIREIIPR